MCVDKVGVGMLRAYVEVKDNFRSWFSPMLAQGLISGHQTWWQAPLLY